MSVTGATTCVAHHAAYRWVLPAAAGGCPRAAAPKRRMARRARWNEKRCELVRLPCEESGRTAVKRRHRPPLVNGPPSPSFVPNCLLCDTPPNRARLTTYCANSSLPGLLLQTVCQQASLLSAPPSSLCSPSPVLAHAKPMCAFPARSRRRQEAGAQPKCDAGGGWQRPWVGGRPGSLWRGTRPLESRINVTARRVKRVGDLGVYARHGTCLTLT